MIVWRLIGDEIGVNGNGAAYFPTKGEALYARREYMSDEGNGKGRIIEWPEPVSVTNRKELADALNDAMGYGAS